MNTERVGGSVARLRLRCALRRRRRRGKRGRAQSGLIGARVRFWIARVTGIACFDPRVDRERRSAIGRFLARSAENRSRLYGLRFFCSRKRKSR